ncbi:MAG: S8 family serine peptidase [Micromonosporaceae bacterium]|nr:S8 family serine peptidase [Micromonosporaceae bacterium]
MTGNGKLLAVLSLRWRAAAAATLAVVVAVTTSCTSDDADDAPPPVTGLTAEPAGDGDVRLAWDPVEGVDGYRVYRGGTAVDVPPQVCDQGCTITLAPGTAGDGGEVAVSAVREGAASEPATVPVDVSRPAPPGGEEQLEVLLVYAGTPPVTETVEVDSVAEAEAVIEDARGSAFADERLLLSANLNSRAQPAAQADPPGPVPQAWQAEAMEFSLLPGDPPGAGVVVAVLEQGGVDPSHPAFAGATIDPGVHIGDEGQDGRSDPESHAMGVASMILGQPGGVVPGIAPGVTLLPVNIGDARESDLIEAVTWAVDNGADVINVSQAIGDCGALDVIVNCRDGLRQATDYAEEQGVVVVAGAGNNGPGADYCTTPTNAELWPAVLDTVISVGGYAPSGDRWACTPDRSDIDLLAPSADLLVADVGGGYRVGSGTSFASPLVAGLVAAILAEQPDLTPAEIRALLPQWVRANGNLSVAAALTTLGIIAWDPPLDLDSIARAYPYHVDVGFPAGHPVSVAMTSNNQLRTLGWIDGVIFVNDDGTATASGVFEFQYGPNRPTGGPEWTARASRTGYSYECPTGGFVPDWWDIELWVERRVRWGIPVTVDVTVDQDGEGGPAFGLSFSLGVGATSTAPGSLPPVTVMRDTMDVCAAYLEWYNSDGTVGFLSGTRAPEFSEVQAEAQDYFETTEGVLQLLIDSSPYQLTDPVSSAATPTPTTLTGDPGVEVLYWDIHLYRQRTAG